MQKNFFLRQLALVRASRWRVSTRAVELLPCCEGGLWSTSAGEAPALAGLVLTCPDWFQDQPHGVPPPLLPLPRTVAILEAQILRVIEDFRESPSTSEEPSMSRLLLRWRRTGFHALGSASLATTCTPHATSLKEELLAWAKAVEEAKT